MHIMLKSAQNDYEVRATSYKAFEMQLNQHTNCNSRAVSSDIIEKITVFGFCSCAAIEVISNIHVQCTFYAAILHEAQVSMQVSQ